MDFSNRTYIAVREEDLDLIDFSQVVTDSIDHVRKIEDGVFLIRFDGDEPPTLINIVKVQYDGRSYHTREEMLSIMDRVNPPQGLNDD